MVRKCSSREDSLIQTNATLYIFLSALTSFISRPSAFLFMSFLLRVLISLLSFISGQEIACVSFNERNKEKQPSFSSSPCHDVVVFERDDSCHHLFVIEFDSFLENEPAKRKARMRLFVDWQQSFSIFIYWIDSITCFRNVCSLPLLYLYMVQCTTKQRVTHPLYLSIITLSSL